MDRQLITVHERNTDQIVEKASERMVQSCGWERKGLTSPSSFPVSSSPLLNCCLLPRFSLSYTAAHVFTFHPLICSFQPDPNLKLLRKSLISIKWLNIKCAFQTISQITSWEHLTCQSPFPRGGWVWSLMNCDASLPFHMLALFAVFFPLSLFVPVKAHVSLSLPKSPWVNSSHPRCRQSCTLFIHLILRVPLCGIRLLTGLDAW